MTPSEHEWLCERLDLIAEGIVAQYADKAEQARERPELVGWFVGQVMKRLNGSVERGMIESSIKTALKMDS